MFEGAFSFRGRLARLLYFLGGLVMMRHHFPFSRLREKDEPCSIRRRPAML